MGIHDCFIRRENGKCNGRWELLINTMMDTYVDERDYKLLEADKYTFFVLKRIMSGECKLLLSDHERMIFCFTGHPFPVWIWTADDASEEEMEKTYQLACKELDCWQHVKGKINARLYGRP